ncbi:Retrovirus-related Pol polyprotein from transposon gypsy, partial [Dictyocoela muelleri]
MNEIRETPTLHHPDFKKHFTLKCDASKTGIGSVLTQNDKLIGIFSSKFSGPEENYSVVEKEVLAIIKSLKHFKSLIYNSKIYILTDNKNLTFNGELTKRIE